MTNREKNALMTTAQIIRLLLDSNDLSIDEAAKVLGLPKETLSNLESGRHLPTSSEWFRICQKFEIDSEFEA